MNCLASSIPLDCKGPFAPENEARFVCNECAKIWKLALDLGKIAQNGASCLTCVRMALKCIRAGDLKNALSYLLGESDKLRSFKGLQAFTHELQNLLNP
jgi:hypothetical protein